MFRKFIKKVKEKKNKIFIFILGLLVLINIVAAAYFIYSIMLFNGTQIEDVIRYGIIVIAIIMAIIFIRLWICTVIKDKKLIYFIFTLFLILSISAQGFYKTI